MDVSEDREKRIREIMTMSGLPRSDAELAVAIESGELDGDARIIGDTSPVVTVMDILRP